MPGRSPSFLYLLAAASGRLVAVSGFLAGVSGASARVVPTPR
jgi:hypothetical protein